MEIVETTDYEGNKIKYKKYKGRAFHLQTFGDVGNQLRMVDTFKVRPDDVFLCTFPKSGSHWVGNIINALITESSKYLEGPLTLEFHDLTTADEDKNQRIICTHLSYPFIPAAVKAGTGKVINVLRNPKDTFVSAWKFFSSMVNIGYAGNMDGFFRFFLSDEFYMSASWFNYVKEWTDGKANNPNMQVHTVWYEDLKADLYSEVSKISKFLGTRNDEKFLREVESIVSFQSLKTAHETDAGAVDRWKDICKDGRLPIYRKGVIGDWKNELTVAQNELIDSMIKEKLAGYNLNLRGKRSLSEFKLQIENTDRVQIENTDHLFCDRVQIENTDHVFCDRVQIENTDHLFCDRVQIENTDHLFCDRVQIENTDHLFCD
ncbi:sulfotransferase 1C2-like [Ylistrum balloti]|uniref:sulfotransferase 1C2-like n=1 Tax=Ylistrum balloti TaxID=509963 RepID=UPI002905DF3A|nr:sulfotransferase 1C2-like [Ylistrum balloti]